MKRKRGQFLQTNLMRCPQCKQVWTENDANRNGYADGIKNGVVATYACCGNFYVEPMQILYVLVEDEVEAEEVVPASLDSDGDEVFAVDSDPDN